MSGILGDEDVSFGVSQLMMVPRLKWILEDDDVGCHGSRDIIDAQGCWGLVASWLNWFLGGDESMVKVDPGA